MIDREAWLREPCKANGCHGCFVVLMSCGHSFECVRDPAIGKHRCAAMWTPLLFSLFMAACAMTIVIALARR
jgi:hypothetical protein